MSLEQPSRLANWPRIAIRVALILLVFVGLNWWMKTQQKQQATSPTVVEQTYAPHATELRDGIAVMFLWDVQSTESQLEKSPSLSWLEAGAGSLHHQLQRLTRYAGEHSEVPLRVGVRVAGCGPSQGSKADGVIDVVKMDAPVSGEEISEALKAIRPGVKSYDPQLKNQAQLLLVNTGLRERHMIIISADPPEEAGDMTKMMNGEIATHVHFINRRHTVSEMDAQFKTILDEILSPIR